MYHATVLQLFAKTLLHERVAATFEVDTKRSDTSTRRRGPSANYQSHLLRTDPDPSIAAQLNAMHLRPHAQIKRRGEIPKRQMVDVGCLSINVSDPVYYNTLCVRLSRGAVVIFTCEHCEPGKRSKNDLVLFSMKCVAFGRTRKEKRYFVNTNTYDELLALKILDCIIAYMLV